MIAEAHGRVRQPPASAQKQLRAHKKCIRDKKAKRDMGRLPAWQVPFTYVPTFCVTIVGIQTSLTLVPFTILTSVTENRRLRAFVR